MISLLGLLSLEFSSSMLSSSSRVMVPQTWTGVRREGAELLCGRGGRAHQPRTQGQSQQAGNQSFHVVSHPFSWCLLYETYGGGKKFPRNQKSP